MSLTVDADDDLDYYYSDYEETYSDVWDNCIFMSFSSILPTIYKLIGANLCFGLILSLATIPEWLFHVLSCITGLYMLQSLESTMAIVLVVVFVILSYPLLNLVELLGRLEMNKALVSMKFMYISNLVLCEYFLVDNEVWSQIRGVLMIFTMKFISLMEIQRTIKVPNVIKYLGYTFCGANILFGPWLAYQDYRKLYMQPTKKSYWWFIGILKALILSVLFLTVSNCWGEFFIPYSLNRWFTAYREGLAVRTSHYFISYLSEASMLAAGYKCSKRWSDPSKWNYPIVNPWVIEFPTALAIVVTNWNIPMHEFLKKYIYKPYVPHGKFLAILATFLVSSFLHGFALQVSIVLILLGVFSYIQIEIRNYLANVFHMCIKIYPCKDCNHSIPRTHYKSRIMLAIFSVFTVLHLIYLGVILNESTNEVGIYEKWRSLYFVSFWVILFDLAIIKL